MYACTCSCLKRFQFNVWMSVYVPTLYYIYTDNSSWHVSGPAWPEPRKKSGLVQYHESKGLFRNSLILTALLNMHVLTKKRRNQNPSYLKPTVFDGHSSEFSSERRKTSSQSALSTLPSLFFSSSSFSS